MKRFVIAAAMVIGLVSPAPAQQITVVPVNGGTGNLVSIPIPGGNGLSVTVGTGSAAMPLDYLYHNPTATPVNIGDDDNVYVPLPFVFPYFGQSFTESWMHANGVVAFQNPGITGNFCCNGLNLSTLTDPRYNYAIMPMWTDLININGSHYYSTTATSATYGWYNVSEYYDAATQNSFELTINSSGAINTRLGGAMVSRSHSVTSGMTGNLANGEYFQYYHGSGLQIDPGSALSWSALSGTGGGSLCLINPLSDPTCPGYQAAYQTQQCNISSLWDPVCPGYQQAYFNQQCNINSLYNSACPGYETAYFNQQCSADSLYSMQCPGYAIAYLNQQCAADPLYSTTCSGYAAAYAAKNVAVAPDPVAAAAPLVADPVVNNVITAKPTADANPAAVVKLTAPAPTPAAAPTVDDKKSESSSVQTAKTEDKPAEKPKTAREALVEQRREAAKKEAVARGKDLANEMGRAADMQAQIDVQNVVIQAMGFLPGFDVYGRAMPDGRMYRPYQVYPGQRNIDTPAGRRLFGSSDAAHQQMVDSQYNLGN